MAPDILLQNINSLFGTLFSSIDNSIYTALDEITFINEDILHSYYLENIFGNTSSGLLLIANSLLLGFVIYYIISYWLFSVGIIQINQLSPDKFFFRILLSCFFMNSSFILCEKIIYLNSLLSEAIRTVGYTLLHININFSSLISNLNGFILLEECNNYFSIEGLLKIIFSFGFFSLIFSYSIRYILLKILILLSPLSFLTLCQPTTSNFFKIWIKSFGSLLFMELLTSLILIIMFSIILSVNNIISKLLLMGSLFTLLKCNTYIKEFLGGISTEFSDNLYFLRTFIK